MKGNKIMGIIWILIAAFFIWLLITKLSDKTNKSIFNLSINTSVFNNCKLLETKTLNKDDFNQININLISENLEFQKSIDDKVYVELYCTEETKPEVKVENNSLSVNAIQKKVVTFSNRKVVIKLPESTNIQNTNIVMKSGNIHFDNYKTDKLNIQNISGSIHINNLICDSENFNCKSGSIHINNLICDTGILECISGSIHINNSTVSKIEISSKSGSIHIEGNYDKVDLSTISGSINGNFNKVISQDSNFNTTSGSIHIRFPNDANFKSVYSVGSGSYRNSMTGTYGKNGNEQVNNNGPEINFHATSGSITIN